MIQDMQRSNMNIKYEYEDNCGQLSCLFAFECGLLCECLIQEPSTCAYEMEFMTPLACSREVGFCLGQKKNRS